MSASFSDVAAAANVSHHFHARSSEVSSISPSALERSRLNDEQKAFVRNCLYPDDTRLYRHVCETSARAGRGAATARTAGHAGLSAWQAKLFAMVEADAAEKAAVAQRILLAALQADGRHSTGVLSQGVDGGAWLNEMLAVTELTHSLHLSDALAFAARAHNHTASHFPLHLATDWEQGMQVKMVSRMGKGVGGGSSWKTRPRRPFMACVHLLLTPAALPVARLRLPSAACTRASIRRFRTWATRTPFMAM